MEQARFDHLARGLAAGLSRRGMVRTLTGAALGGLVLAVGAGEAGARKKKRGSGKRQGVGASGAKDKCPRPNRCGKGKHAQCCTGNQLCKGGICETDPRTVSLSFESFDQFHTHCWVTVQVTGFAAGSHDGFIGSQPFTITVDAAGTGSWSSQSINTIWGVGGAIEATVDGVASDPVDLIC